MAEKQAVIRIHPDDTVIVALRPLKKGEVIALPGGGTVTVAGDIPAGHKIALGNIAAGDRIIKYGHSIGAAISAIPAGSHVHTHNMKTLLSETPEYHYDPKAAASYAQTPMAEAAVPDIDVFRRKDGQIGIRNEVWIVPTVGCVNRTAEALASWANAECTKPFDIDGVYAWTHPYGCSQMGDDHATTRTILADLVKHPNAGAVLVIGLGCENNTVDEFKKMLGDYDGERVQFLVTQQVSDEITEGREMLKKLAEYAGKFKREKAKASELIIGMKCGGSDGFSGITANALVGQVCDEITAMGGSSILTEVPEMFGAEQMLMDRCETRELFDKTVSLITDFKDYYTSHNQVVYENPSPGNKDGGITTLEDKSCGCVQKGGKAPVRGVYKYGERISGKGLQLLEGPGNDIVSTTAMTAAGAHIILFTTGRGTPLGAPIPTIKISSNSDLAQRKPNWIDFDAGRMLVEDAALVRGDIMRLILDIASGKQQTRNEINGYREIAIFKDGVTL
jgi:altronate hydrolase